MQNPGIYILTNRVNGKQYVGLDSNLPRRAKQHLNGTSKRCPLIHGAIQKHGREAFRVETIAYPNITHEALCAVEMWQIAKRNTKSPNGYNLTDGGEGRRGYEWTPEQKAKQSEIQRQLVKDGTHHLLGGDLHRKIQRQRVKDGTHNFLDSEFQRKTAQKRVIDGTHPFLKSDWQRENQHKRVKNGTHPFLSGDIQRKASRQRVKDGTHHFLGKTPKSITLLSHLAKAKYKLIFYHVALIPKAYWDALNTLHRTRKLTREGFFDAEIADTSQATQQTLFS